MAEELESSTADAPRRLFFALWPDEALSRRLLQLGKSTQALSGGRLMRRETLHLTLAFLGAVAPDKVAAAEGVAATLRGRAFDLQVDHLGCWPHLHLLWAGPEVIPPALMDLATELQAGLRAAGFALEKRPFAPHITLLRKARTTAELPRIDALSWPAREFVLVESTPCAEGSRYAIIGRWKLAE